MFKNILSCCLFFCSFFTFPLHSSWQMPPIDLSAIQQNATLPHVAVDPNGDATAVWQCFDGSHLIIQASSKLLGGDWQNPVDNLSAEGQDAQNPQIIMDTSGTAIAIWQRFDGNSSVIQTSKKLLGDSWQVTPDNISLPGENAAYPKIIADLDGNLTAVWERSDGMNTIIQAAYQPSGNRWQTPIDLSFPGQNAQNPEITVDAFGNVTVVWQRSNGSNTIIQASTKDFGGNWQMTPDDLSENGQNATNPQAAVDIDGNVTAVWSRFNGNNTIIQASKRSFGGSWQSPPDDLSMTGEDAAFPQVGIGLDDVTVIWQRSNGTNSIIQSTTKLYGSDWESPINLSLPGKNAFFPQLGLDPCGNATVVWQRFDGVNSVIQASIKPDRGVWQTNPDTLSLKGGNATLPQIAIDSNGIATAVWQRFNGSNTIIQSSEGLFIPVVLKLSPNRGLPQGGTTVVISGLLFSSVDLVFFDNVAVDFVVNSDHSITVVTPPGDLNTTVDVFVSSPEGDSVITPFSQFTYGPVLPATSFSGAVVKNRYLTQTDLIHSFVWSPSEDTSVVAYNLYRNGVLIAQIPARGHLTYQDHNRRKKVKDTYTLIALNAEGILSIPLTLILP